MSEGPGQQQRYCTNCGTEIRPGNSFCVSCGTPLTPPTQDEESGPTHPEPPPPGPTYSEPPPFAGPSPSDDPSAQPQDSAEDLKRLPRRALEWFRNLPSVTKLVIVGSVLLVLLIFLSPLAVIVAALLFAVSIIALIIRGVQRRSLKGWGIAAVASVGLMFAFGAMSDVLYGTGFMGDGEGSKDVAYDVVSVEDTPDGNPNYSVVSSANDLESLNVVAQDIQRQRLQTGQGSVGFYKSQAGAKSGDVNDFVGLATIFQNDSSIRRYYSQSDFSLTSEEVEQLVDIIADNGYVETFKSSKEGGKNLPVFPDFMYEPIGSPSASPSATLSSSATLGPSSQVGDEVTFEAEAFGYPEQISYAGTQVIVVIVDYDGTYVAVLADPLYGPGMPLTGAFPGSHLRVSGTYQGTVSISSSLSSGSYPGVLAEDVEFVGS